MKKIAICSLFAAAAAGIIFAASDKLYLGQGGYVTKALAVDDIENITYTNDGNADNYTHMKVDFKNGTSTLVPLNTLGAAIQYYHALEDCPVTIDVMARHQSAQLTVTAPTEDTYYRITGMTEATLNDAGIDESIWGEVLMQNDIAEIHATADFYGQPLSYFGPDQIFEKGSQVRDWFPSESISDNTPIVLAVYTAKIEDEEIVPLSEPTVIRFTTKKLVIEDIDFTITADMTSNSITAKADAPEGYDGPIYVALYTEYEVENTGLEVLMATTAGQLEQAVYRNLGGDWSTVTPVGHVENSKSNLCMGDVYYAVAFGCDYAVITTQPKSLKLTVPEPEVTDDCTFEVTATQQSPSQFTLDITPSNADTRYIGMLIEKSRLTDTYTPALAIGKEIQFMTQMGQIHWDSSELIHTGAASVNTHDGVLEGKYLNIGTEYEVLIFGVDENGTRTTAIKEVDVVPTEVVTDEMTFDVQFGEINASSNWTHYLAVTVTPSDLEAKYVFAYLSESNSYVSDLTLSDEELIGNYVAVQGEWLELNTGVLNKTMSFGSTYDSSAGGYVFKPYIIMLFGYDGAATTPLYLYKVDTATGAIEQLRGPGMTPAE